MGVVVTRQETEAAAWDFWCLSRLDWEHCREEESLQQWPLPTKLAPAYSVMWAQEIFI